MISKCVSRALRAVIKDKNLTIKQAADMADIRPEHLSKYINSKSSISFEKGWEIANRLNDSARYTKLFTDIVKLTLSSASCKYYY